MALALQITLLWLLLAFPVISLASAPCLPEGLFSRGGFAAWDEVSFKGNTSYTVVQASGRNVLKAVARGSASALMLEPKKAAPQHTRLSWSWLVEALPNGPDEATKTGDDFAARVYVIFNNRRTLCYVWSRDIPMGTIFMNPHAPKKVATLVVQSGREGLGSWHEYRRDLADDYAKAFREVMPPIKYLALMTDADQTGSRLTAYYGDITLCRPSTSFSRNKN